MGFLLITATRCSFIGRIIAHESGLSGNEMAGATDRDVGLQLYIFTKTIIRMLYRLVASVMCLMRQLAHLASSLE